MNGIAIYEFDALTAKAPNISAGYGLHAVPEDVFKWLEGQSLQVSEAGESVWLRMVQRRGRPAVQVTSFVGVIRAPNGFQIEVLPKVGKAVAGGESEARKLLIEMLQSLGGFRHIQTDSAKLAARKMPLLEVFIGELLRSIEHVVKRGLRGGYKSRQDNVIALRGKILVAPHLRQNLYRADRFFAEFDDFTTNRPEHRLLHAALRRALLLTNSQEHQRLARELCFAFADIPPSMQVRLDFQRVQSDRGMGYYENALSWTRIILDEESPLTGAGRHHAPSLLFPMELVFESYVAKHLARQMARPHVLKAQLRSHHLVRHLGKDWFRLKPDLVIRESRRDLMVLDTKWKLLDGLMGNGTQKYGLSQSDFYQLQAYGNSYLDGAGNVVLIYPKTECFSEPLPAFEFPKHPGMRLWVLPFCLKDKKMILPAEQSLTIAFQGHH